MDSRLSLIKEMLGHKKCLADIGTDHGYLICEAVAEGIAEKGIASDINEMPLDKARKLVEKNNLNEKIELVCADGLSGIEKNTPDGVVIAGMGGDLIAKIIDEWQGKNRRDVTYFLQPMTKGENLRRYLFENGFSILREECAYAAGKYYVVTEAVFTGEKKNFSLTDIYTGLIKGKNESEKGYLKNMKKVAENKIKGAEAERNPQAKALYEKLFSDIENLLKD